MPNPYLARALREQQERRKATQPAEPEGPTYGALTNANLTAEIDRRNEGRDEADQIVPDGAKKADLIRALEADDTTTQPSEES